MWTYDLEAAAPMDPLSSEVSPRLDSLPAGPLSLLIFPDLVEIPERESTQKGK